MFCLGDFLFLKWFRKVRIMVWIFVVLIRYVKLLILLFENIWICIVIDVGINLWVWIGWLFC